MEENNDLSNEMHNENLNETNPEEVSGTNKVEKESVEENVQTETPLNELEQLQAELIKERNQFVRLYAEFDNYKKRIAKEKEDYFYMANENLILDLIPVLDDFERALAQMKERGHEDDIKGVELIQNKFYDVLRHKGLRKIEVKKGDDFNPDLQEAITQIPASSPDLVGKVMDVVETGYKLGDKIIRYPKVVVGK